MSPTVFLSVKGNNQLFDRNKGELNRKSTSSGQMVTESSFTPPLSKNRLKRHFLLPSNSPKEGINLFLRVIPLLPDTHTFQSTRVVCLWVYSLNNRYEGLFCSMTTCFYMPNGHFSFFGARRWLMVTPWRWVTSRGTMPVSNPSVFSQSSLETWEITPLRRRIPDNCFI